MRARFLAIAAAAWAAGYAAIYLILIAGQGNSPAWWYVAVLAAAVALLTLPAAGRWSRRALISATVLLAFAAAIGAASIGLLLVPAVAAAGFAAAGPFRRAHPGMPPG